MRVANILILGRVFRGFFFFFFSRSADLADLSDWLCDWWACGSLLQLRLGHNGWPAHFQVRSEVVLVRGEGVEGKYPGLFFFYPLRQNLL